MRKRDRVFWFFLVFVSALNGVQAIFTFDKNPGFAIIMGILSIWMLRQAMNMDNLFSFRGKVMSDKIVAMLSEDQELEATCKRINQRRQFADKRMEDFQKQMQEKMEALQKENSADWDTLTAWLKNNGRLPEGFNDQTHNISFNLKDNGVRVGKNSDRPSFPGPGKIKNMGAFSMEELPPELKTQMDKFIKSQMEGKDDE